MPPDRIERIKSLSKLALGILRRCGERCCIDRAGTICRLSEVRHNEFRLTLLIDNKDRTSTLDARFDGKIVLHIEWTEAQVLRTAYKAGDWEAMLLRYDRTPALAGRAQATS